jgi:ferric-dicitrate binding protein FerR (iron transport regulator)
MSTSVPPRDGSTATGSAASGAASSVLADEQALKRAFDANFETFLSSAQSQLGDAPSLAPRVVEVAFINAWNQRAAFATQDQLNTFLADEIRHGSARALSRRFSGHRMGAMGGGAQSEAHAATQADPAKVWSQIERAIHGEGHSAEAHAAAATAGRHDAASHMKSVAKSRSWAPAIGIGVAALALALAGAFYMNRLGEDDAVLSAVSTQGIQPIASSPGQIGSLTLGDGTKMRIGPETKVMIPEHGFPEKVRAVRVDGTASFDVAAGQALPFRAVAKRIQFIASGTKFVVSAFPTDSGVRVKVLEGTVTAKVGKQMSTVTAGQALFITRDSMRAPTEAEAAEAFGWVDGHIAVQHQQLRRVVGALTRWFNYDVKVPDLPLLDRDASFSVPLDSSRLAISQVEESANVKFSYEGESKVFRDATGKVDKAKVDKAKVDKKKKK